MALSGYEVPVYRLGLARAYLQTGALRGRAWRASKQAAAPGRPVRRRVWTSSSIACGPAWSRRRSTPPWGARRRRVRARKFLEAWNRADRGLADVAQARRLAGLQ